MPVDGFRAREAEVQINDGLGNLRRWTATADPSLLSPTFDYTPGSSVVITLTEFVLGAGVQPADAVYINLYDEGTLIKQFLATNPPTGQSFTFWFTHDGTSTGTASASTIELAVHAAKGGIGGYDVESDGSPDSPPATFETHLYRGYLRNVTTAAVSTTNQGGTKPALFAYDDTINHRLTWGHRRYRASTFTASISGATPALTATTPSTAGPVWDTTFANVVDERFPASSTTQSATWTVPNSFAGLPLVTLTTNTADSLTIDPRLTAAHHFQVDDNTFAVASHDPSFSMLNTESGFLWTVFRNARGEGVNGLTVVQTLVPVKPGDTFTATATTTTQDGQAGVSGRLNWTASKPGGIWNKTSDVTAPSDIDADSHLVGATLQHVLLAPDPNIIVRGYVNKQAAPKDHFSEGDSVVINIALVDLTTFTRIDPARVTDPKVAIIRYRSSDDRLEYLHTDETWSLWEPTGAASTFPLAASPNDPRNYIRVFADTTGWGRDLMAVLFTVTVDGTPYSGFSSREEVGRAHSHSSAGGALVTARTDIA